MQTWQRAKRVKVSGARLFSDAEAGKYAPEEVIGRKSASDLAESLLGRQEVLGGELGSRTVQ